MNEHLLVLREFLSGIAPPLIMGLIGAISYGLICGIRRGFHNINEKEFLLIITEFAALVPALKIIILSFDQKLPVDNYFDRLYLIIAGALTILVTIKDIITKFR